MDEDESSVAVVKSGSEHGHSVRLQKARGIKAMRKAFVTVKKRQRANIARVVNLENRKQRLLQTRKESIGNAGLLEQAVANLERNGIKVKRARTGEEAVSLVQGELAGEKLVVKSKSNLTKEVGLVEALAARGVEVVETDTGDRIIQVIGEKPSHPTGPASHLSKQEIADRLSTHFGQQIEPTAEAIVELVRDEIAAYISNASVGITGANAIAAEEGAVLLMHNEGNIIQVATRPGKHIIMAGIDKIYPNSEEALNMLKLQAFYATGALSTSFINIIAGTSQTADIEKKLIKGVHGPREMCLVLVDNHRSEIADSDYRELLYCIGCGQCLLVCPAYSVYGSEFSANSQLGGKGVVYAALNGEEADGGELDICLSCRHCQKNCPLAIDTSAMVNRLRLERHRRLREPHLAGAYDFVRAHIDWIGNALALEATWLLAKLRGLGEDRG
ncbi:MAG: lactate utilization protein [Chloroflexi bacterium]|nr:lactate utilization protein [Chloroflexota bacterium]